MPRVRVEGFTLSLDGYAAGPDQTLEHPLGVGAEGLHGWLVATRHWRAMHGKDGGESGVDDRFAARSHAGVGAWIMGRNMFGPVRGPWPDHAWQGWWGDDPPFAGPVFVLSHHARPTLAMPGGTVFHFVTEGAQAALERARAAAGEQDVQVSGGADTIRQYLAAGQIDELHVAISPVLLGSGERLFEGTDLRAAGYACVEFVPTQKAAHMVLRRE